MGGPGALAARKPGFLSDENSQQVAPADDGEHGLTIQLVPEALIIGRVNLPTTDGTDKLRVELFPAHSPGRPRKLAGRRECADASEWRISICRLGRGKLQGIYDGRDRPRSADLQSSRADVWISASILSVVQ